MTEPILFYSPGACSLAVQVALLDLDRPHRLCRADRAVRQTPAFLAINPEGKVPALRTGDGRVLAEVSALLLHLYAGTPDAPVPGTARHDAAQQLLSYLGSGFHAAFYPYFNPQRFVDDPDLHDAVRRAAEGQVRVHLGLVADRLGDRPWLLEGDAPSFLDPYLFAMTRWATRFVDLEAEFPRVAAHRARTGALPDVVRALDVEARGPDAPVGGACLGHVSLPPTV